MCLVVSLATVVCLITREFRQCCLNISREGGWGATHNAGSVHDSEGKNMALIQRAPVFNDLFKTICNDLLVLQHEIIT